METNTLPVFTKKNKSREEYKEIWLSLFDVNVLASCNEKDSDLFCASALLKTAFYNFIRLKKRLNQTQQLLRSQKLQLETLKLESEKSISEINCLKSSRCIRCQKLEGSILLPVYNLSQLEPNMQRSDKLIGNEVKNQSELSGPETHVCPSEFMKVLDDKILQDKTRPVIPKCLISKTQPSGNDNVFKKNELLDLKAAYLKDESIYCENSNKCNSKKIVHNTSEREEEMCLCEEDNSVVSKGCKPCSTPENNSCALEVQNISPILKQSKKSKVSPSMISRVKKSEGGLAHNSPFLLSSDSKLIDEVLLKKDRQGSVEKIVSEASSAFDLKNKATISSLSLKLKQPHVSLTNCTFAEINVPTYEIYPNNAEANKEICDSYHSPEKEEVEIIMPSPRTSNARNLAQNPESVISPRKLGGTNKNGGKSNNGAKSSKPREQESSVLSDTDVTYFVRMEDLDAMENGSEDESAEVLTHPSIEERVGGDQENVDEREAAPEEGEDSCTLSREHPQVFSSSFDQLPLKNNSPPYKYQRAAVRRKDERRKLFGWECKDCQKYYEIAGYGMDSAERKMHLNKCSRHRYKYSPYKNTPKGFWNPLFPDTPK